MKKIVKFLLVGFSCCCISACSNDNSASLLPPVAKNDRVNFDDSRLLNDEAPIPPQCYTRTEGENNPCYVCHQVYGEQAGYRMNKLNDGYLQGGYRFSDVGETNHWNNLFVDKSDFVERIGDQAILEYINQDNYSVLARDLENRNWKGFIPDLQHYADPELAFDEYGMARDGSHWVAFNYKPFPSTFWPTNGSTDDVLIRLPAEFRESDGLFSLDIYRANLALLELAISEKPETTLPPVDETRINHDLNQDGSLSTAAQRIVRHDHYLGDASNVALVAQQYPAGTQFMHSVRYVNVNDDGSIGVSRRMKELRYMTKLLSLQDHELSSRYARERKEKFEEKLPRYIYHGEKGFENGLGWMIQGYIEDYDGRLRPQSYEEGMFCMGCHTAIGSTIDQVFSFARKLEGASGWGYIDLKGMRDAPVNGEQDGEYLDYLRRVRGGNEFRANSEMQQRWFDNGVVNESKVKAADVYQLITPSPARALELNKAYSWIVRHQSYIYGRDANRLPVNNVLRNVDESVAPLRPEFRRDNWDMRLNWSN